jgi:hypothetical protein
MAIPSDGRAFVAEGTVEEKYAGMTRMYVGIVQLTRNGGRIDISGAAYGVGAPEWKQSLNPARLGDSEGWETAEAVGGGAIRVRRWAMELRADYEHPLRPGPAVGFVLGEMPGGRVTGWIEDELKLTGGPSTRLEIHEEARDAARDAAYGAVLSAQQHAAAEGAQRKLEQALAEAAAAKARAEKAEEAANAVTLAAAEEVAAARTRADEAERAVTAQVSDE